MVWAVICSYMLLVVLFHIPSVQGYMGTRLGNMLQGQFGTRFDIGRINVGFLNRLIIDDIAMYDQQGKPMIASSRLSVKISYLDLLQGKITITSAQLFGMKALLYQKDAKTPANYQFALDSLASDDSKEPTPIDLRINSLIIRHGQIRYDRYDIPCSASHFNAGHINVSDISAHLIIRHITNSSIDARLKKLSFKEASGLDIKNIAFALNADRSHANADNITLRFNDSHLNIDSVRVAYAFAGDSLIASSLRYSGNISNTLIVPANLSSFIPQLKQMASPLYFSCNVSGTSSALAVNNIGISAQDGGIKLQASANIHSTKAPVRWDADIRDITVSQYYIAALQQVITRKPAALPRPLAGLGNIHITGRGSGHGNDIAAQAVITTQAGKALLKGNLKDNMLSAHVNTDGIDLKRIMEDSKLGMVAASIDMSGALSGGKPGNVSAKGLVSRLDYNGYTFNNISLDASYARNSIKGNIAIDDPNGKISLEGMVSNISSTPSCDIRATVNGLRPNTMRLTSQWGGTSFSANLAARLSGKSLSTMTGEVDLSQFVMTSPDTSYCMDNMHITAGNNRLHLASDFADVLIEGRYNLALLGQSLANIVGKRLPTLPGLPTYSKQTDNSFTINASLKRADWLNALFGIPLHIDAETLVKGCIDDSRHYLNLSVSAPGFTYDGSRYSQGRVSIDTPSDTLTLSAALHNIKERGRRMDLQVNARAAGNSLATDVAINLHQPRPIKGVISTVSQFFKDEDGASSAHVNIRPSVVLVNDSAWHIQPGDIVYSPKRTIVDHFMISRNQQHIKASGLLSAHPGDSLDLELQDIDISYILNLVNFHSVEFKGLASGHATVKHIFANPEAYANLKVRQFKFENGDMGTLTANTLWNKELKQIDIDAHADDDKGGKTVIKGYVSPPRNRIDLGITAHNTNLEFLQSFTGSFMDNIRLNGNGAVRLHGLLSDINLTGQMVAKGQVHVKTLNTTYTLPGDTITLIPDEILFNRVLIKDRNGNTATVNGALHHKSLTRLTFDLGITTRNLLCYDFGSYGTNTFFGTVYGTGQCDIKGRSGRIDFDIDITPNKGSFIEYNAASPDAVGNQQFITWTGQPKLTDITTKSQELPDSTSFFDDEDKDDDDVPTDIRINFLVNATPDFTLRVLMDKNTGDHIALQGNGGLHATYYNKGSFDMFGTYFVENGVYKLTIQELIKKDFMFQPGSQIVFGGDPYNAALNLKAMYTVNGVPLSDLQIGNSFSSNNVRVDCMMNINGTPEHPRVDFDLDLPTVNNDAKQMIKSIINSEEEMNQQVIYLLGVGRFYAQERNNEAGEDAQRSQTSLAMQSLLSGTMSQQINSLLGNLIKNDNWNFGANISTGDEGFSNAEYEGMLSGRLLNNRLLINGQFGYRDNANATTSFIGDFDIRYLLFPNGNMQIKVYNQTNDRYFTKSSLNTQGIGLILKKDFTSLSELFGTRKKKGVAVDEKKKKKNKKRK